MACSAFSAEAWRRAVVLSCAGMRGAEQKAAAQGLVSLDAMMQRAGMAVAREIQARWTPCRVLVLCGPGNNGGDGYVVATALRQAGWEVRVAALPAAKLSAEAERAKAAWGTAIEAVSTAGLAGAELIVDALFGTGLQRSLADPLLALFREIGAQGVPVVAVDIPSGVSGDTGAVLGAALACQLTVTFFRKKAGHVLLPGGPLCGAVVVADIGISDDVLDEEDLLTVENNEDLWRDDIPLPGAAAHKYTRGHALVYGGGVMTGAARLATRAAQRMGAGLVTLAAPAAAVPLYASALESVIVRETDDLPVWQELIADPARRSILIGPGLGRDPGNKAYVLAALAARKSTVLDADALSVFADEPAVLLEALHEACVLTPHEGEFTRLFPQMDPGADKITRTRQAAQKAGCVVLLKGADTVIATPDGFAAVNTDAPPWLATGGAGDVLSGMILGLVTAGMPPVKAAMAAAWEHGAIAAAFGPGLIAEDIVDGIPARLKSILLNRREG